MPQTGCILPILLVPLLNKTLRCNFWVGKQQKTMSNNPTDKDKILQFLKTFIPDYQSDSTANSNTSAFETGTGNAYTGTNHADLERLDINAYTQVPLEEDVQQRIERLQQIAGSIESRIIHPQPNTIPTPPDAAKYKIDYLNSLNPNQYLAATTINGPLLVIAGAGSGKTRTVIYRTAYLLESGIPPEQILLLTFTRKAATEIVHRTAQLLKNNLADKIMRGTYHAFANHTLRHYAAMLKLPPNFTIIDTADSEDVIDLIRQEMHFSKKHQAFPKKSRIQTIISKARNCNVTIEEVLRREYTALLEFTNDLNLLAEAYRQYKQANKLFDYDDLMDTLRDSLRDNLPFRKTMQKNYRYIMVDEFQDTNVVQKEILDYIAQGSRNIMVVGDDAQSIYAFRGANFENILTFPATYPDCKVVKIEQNYRSHQQLLNFTNAVANNAKLGYRKALFSANQTQVKPIVAKLPDQEAEAAFVVDKILELREKGIALSDIAVIYRATFHSNFIQTELLRRSIPYVVVGGIKFTERRHIKDIIACLRIVLNPFDAVAWNRILKLVPGIGQVTAGKIMETIQQQQGKIDFSGLEKRKYGPDLLLLQEAINQAMRPDVTIATKIEALKNYYAPILRNLEADYEARLQDIDVLYTLACKYETLERFLSDFALDPPATQFQNQNAPLIDESEDKPLTLTTVHSAKGLEWYAVFVPHLLDGLFPSVRALKNMDQLEEERRLFYVACSRAKELLYLTMPFYFNSWDQYYTMPSRFLAEVHKNTFKIWKDRDFE